MPKIFIPLLFLFFIPMAVSAVDFDPDYLISDNEMTNYQSMDLVSIEKFLDKRPGTLKGYITVDKEGEFKTASQTFYETAQRWMINPKYLMVLVQKEMGLLDDTTPKQSQYDWATGYGCPDGSGCNDRWQGFYKQVNSAAAQTRYYMDTIHEFNYQPNKTYNIDGYSVTPENTATAGLYNYTPHVDCGGDCGGNKLFWDLWNKYFDQKWPDGSLLATADSDTVYLIENELKRAITSKSVLISFYDPAKIITITADDLAQYADGVPVKYYNFSFLEDDSGNVYMIVGDEKRKFQTRDLFVQNGFNEDELLKATTADLAVYRVGADITPYTLYPAGALLKDEKTDELYYVISGKKKPIANDEILKYNFPGMTIAKANQEELDKYRTGLPVTLPDGMLVKSPKINTVYVISNGKKLTFFNSNAFLNMKYGWSNVTVVSQETIDIHPDGQLLTGEW